METTKRIGFVEKVLVNLHDWTVLLPRGISSKKDLLEHLAIGLCFPDGFGMNWDALSDFLRDLEWISQRVVVIIHQDSPKLVEEELRAYMDVLDDAIADWKPHDAHELKVYFPKSYGRTAG